MARYNKTNIGSGYNSTTAINTELDKIKTAIVSYDPSFVSYA